MQRRLLLVSGFCLLLFRGRLATSTTRTCLVTLPSDYKIDSQRQIPQGHDHRDGAAGGPVGE